MAIDLNFDKDLGAVKSDGLIDEEWVTSALSVSLEDYTDDMMPYLYHSGVVYETMDTSIGGHLTLNPPYGFTPGADSYYVGKVKGRVRDVPEGNDFNIGMGRKYYEYIQKNSKVRTLTLEFGVPKFKSILSYMTGATDYATMIIVAEGRSPKFYYTGNAIGTVAALVVNPVFTASFYALKALWGVAFGFSDPRFYALKPAMHNYYMSVNNMMQVASANRGFTRLDVGSFDKTKDSNKTSILEPDKGALAKAMPRIFNKDGVIDILAITGRYQRLLNEKLINEINLYDSGDVEKIDKEYEFKDGADISVLHNKLKGLASFIQTKKKEDSAEGLTDKDFEKNEDGTTNNTDKSSWASEAASYFSSGVLSSSNAIHLQVEYIPQSSDSFSNSTKNLPIEEFTSSVSRTFRDIRFSMGGLVAGSVVEDVVKAGRDIAWGVLDSASFNLTNVIHGLTGGGYLEYPLMWDDSSSDVSSHTFKISLGGPYGNTASLLMDIDLVLYSLLAGMLPRAIGRASYGPPLLCKAFLPGRQITDFGMIDSLSIERGSGGIKQAEGGAVLSVDISFTIKDFNKSFTAPIDDGFLGVYNLALDEYSMANKYIKLISGVSYSDNSLGARRGLIRLSALYGGISNLLSPSTLGLLSGSFLSGKTAKISQPFTSEFSGVWAFNK